MTTEVQEIPKKISLWKAPGPDHVQVFRIKHLTELERIQHQLRHLIILPEGFLNWLTTGRTTPIQKDKAKGTDPTNYTQITCLLTTWKLLPGIIADRISRHPESSRLVATEQTRERPESRGSKEQLLRDNAVCSHSKKRTTILAMAWIDYQKAYHLVPHSWILRDMVQHGVTKQIIRLTDEYTNQWNTQQTPLGTRLGNIVQ